MNIIQYTALPMWQTAMIAAIPLLLAITVHEVAHGWVAWLRGDDTAKRLGRLTLNPIKHIDPVGTIMVPAALFLTTSFIFGWAKPVPVDTQRLKKPKLDMAPVALAGPLSNALMALGWLVLLWITQTYFTANTPSALGVGLMAQYGIQFNLLLGLFNCLPFPPLDGSRVLMAYLPDRLGHWLMKIERYGLLIIGALVLFGWLTPLVIIPMAFILSQTYVTLGLGFYAAI